MTIRAATHADVTTISALWNVMIRDTLATFTTQEKTPHDVADLIRARRHAFWVTDVCDGFVTWGPFRDGPGYRHTVEHSIIVGNTGQGTGSALLTHALTTAAAQGHHVMVAAISGENPRAQAFHARHGFARVGLMPQVGHKAGGWLDLVLMQKMLIND